MMTKMKTHQKSFGVYHWDTFDNETFLVSEHDTRAEAESSVNDKYGERICRSGADKVDIVNQNGDVLRSYSVR